MSYFLYDTRINCTPHESTKLVLQVCLVFSWLVQYILVSTETHQIISKYSAIFDSCS